MDNRIQKALANFLGHDKLDSRDLSLEPLTGGLSCASLFKFNLSGHSYVLRILPPQANQISPLHQILLAKNAGKLGIGPIVHFVDSMDAIVMDYIPGRTVTPSDFSSMSELESFAKFIRQLHQSQDPVLLATSPFQRFHQFLDKCQEKKVALPFSFDLVKKIMEEIEAILKMHLVPLVFCHLDLNPQNILFCNHRYYLVDWVNGGLSDPYFDLATFAVFHGLNESQSRAFLTFYLDKEPSALEWDRFTIVKPIRLFVIAAAFLSTQAEGVNSTDYDEMLRNSKVLEFSDFISLQAKGEAKLPPWQIGLIMLKAGLELIQSGGFKSSISHLQQVMIEQR